VSIGDNTFQGQGGIAIAYSAGCVRPPFGALRLSPNAPYSDWFCIRGSGVKLSVCGDYRMDIIVSIIFLAFIALLVYASIDATKHPK